jgi:hypothetical protein
VCLASSADLISGGCQRSRISSVSTTAQASAIIAEINAIWARLMCRRSCTSLIPVLS